MVYFRVLPARISDCYEWFLGFFFKFATTYTEESILDACIKSRANPPVDADLLRAAGYSEEEIAEARYVDT